MKTNAAVLREMGRLPPYAESRPLSIEEVETSGPGLPGLGALDAYADLERWKEGL